MAWEPIPVGILGDGWRSPIRSGWVFILRAGATTGAERHPNSHQRMVSFQGTGDLQTGAEGRWESYPLVSDGDADLERRWVSIPAKAWHKPVAPDVELGVGSFCTIPARGRIR